MKTLNVVTKAGHSGQFRMSRRNQKFEQNKFKRSLGMPDDRLGQMLYG
jgi:hypothetical protein